MILINFLDGCPYCMEAESILKKMKIKYKKNLVTQNTKNNYKKKYKMNTFPQIFLNEKNNLSKIGGLDDFNNLIIVCKLIKKYNFKQKHISFIKKVL